MAKSVAAPAVRPFVPAAPRLRPQLICCHDGIRARSFMTSSTISALPPNWTYVPPSMPSSVRPRAIEGLAPAHDSPRVLTAPDADGELLDEGKTIRFRTIPDPRNAVRIPRISFNIRRLSAPFHLFWPPVRRRRDDALPEAMRRRRGVYNNILSFTSQSVRPT